MAREITLWLARDEGGCREVCLFRKNPTWNAGGGLWDTPDPCNFMFLSSGQAIRFFGIDLQPNEKIKLTVTVGRRQKARKG